MEEQHKPYGIYERFFKRPLDLLCGMAAVIVFGWLYIIVAILVRVKLGSPICLNKIDQEKTKKFLNYINSER